MAYQQTNTDNHSNEVLLRQFWHHVYAHYFKKIEFEEIRRIEYLKSFLTEGATSNELPLSPAPSLLAPHPDFQQELSSLFSESYLSKLREEAQMDK